MKLIFQKTHFFEKKFNQKYIFQIEYFPLEFQLSLKFNFLDNKLSFTLLDSFHEKVILGSPFCCMYLVNWEKAHLIVLYNGSILLFQLFHIVYIELVSFLIQATTIHGTTPPPHLFFTRNIVFIPLRARLNITLDNVRHILVFVRHTCIFSTLQYNAFSKL